MGKDPQGRQSLRARVVRIQSAGPVVKVELLTETDQTVFVELSHERFRQEAYAVGDEVSLTPRDSRLFVDDYAT
jgi:sulfate transport system ATP-binding protein